MKLCDVLEIQEGVSAIMGSGGKTGLIQRLAEELRTRGTVLICTTTKMWLPRKDVVCPTVQAAAEMLQETGMAYLGQTDAARGKLCPPAAAGWETLADFVLVEADGAAGRPLKAHAPWEPVLPECRRQTICVVGAAGLGKPIGEAVHRPELFARRCGSSTEAPVTPERVAAVLQAEAFVGRIFINQTDAATGAAVQQLARLLPWPVAAGSLREGTWQRCHDGR